MQFDFIPWETDTGKGYLPMLPIQLNGFSMGPVLIDTGATVTILPMSLCEVLNVELEKQNAIILSDAGGGRFPVYPARRKLEYCIEHSGFRPIRWKGTAFFSGSADTLLLGHFECLDQLVLTLDGPNRKLGVEGRK